MKVKLNSFQEKWVTIEDARFLIIEMDYSELATASMITNENKEMKLDFAIFVNKLVKKSVRNWENLTDNDGIEVPFTASNRDALPFSVKQLIFNKLVTESSVTEEKKTV